MKFDSELLTYEPLASSDNPCFEEFFQLYQDTMPLSERKPKLQIAEMVDTPEYSVLLLKVGDTVTGYSVRFNSEGENFFLLEYMAIHSEFRNFGLGQSLFLHTFQDISTSTNSPVYVLLEVDSAFEESPDQEIRKKRQRFYERLGCLRIENLAYQLPLETEELPPKMDILVYPINGLQPIRKTELKQWLSVIYTNVYNMDPDDPRIAEMLTPVGDPISLVKTNFIDGINYGSHL